MKPKCVSDFGITLHKKWSFPLRTSSVLNKSLMEKFMFCALSITEMRGAIACQKSEKKKKTAWCLDNFFALSSF